MAKKKGRKKKPKPQTEIDLELLQKQYMENKDDREVFEKFFLLLKNYARSLCLKEIKNKTFLSPDRVEEVATEATILFVNQYRKEGWAVWGSFAGVLRWKVVEALYKEADEEKASSLNFVIGENENQEMADIFKKIGATPPWAGDHPEYDPAELLIKNEDISADEIESVIEEASAVMPYHSTFLFYVYLYLHLKRDKTRTAFKSFVDIFLDSKTEDVFELMMLEIRNRIKTYIL